MRLLSAYALIASTILTVPATAAVTIYTDEVAFAAATNSINHNFVSVTPVGRNTSIAVDGVSFNNVGPDDDRVYVQDTFQGANYPQRFFTFQANHFVGNVQTFTGSITGNFSGFGFDYGSYFGASTATLSGTGFSTVINANTTNQKFIGFLSDAGELGPINVTFNGIVLDIITFRTAAAAVPEPASWSMMIGGFGLIGLGMRRKKPSLCFSSPRHVADS